MLVELRKFLSELTEYSDFYFVQGHPLKTDYNVFRRLKIIAVLKQEDHQPTPSLTEDLISKLETSLLFQTLLNLDRLTILATGEFENPLYRSVFIYQEEVQSHWYSLKEKKLISHPVDEQARYGQMYYHLQTVDDILAEGLKNNPLLNRDPVKFTKKLKASLRFLSANQLIKPDEKLLRNIKKTTHFLNWKSFYLKCFRALDCDKLEYDPSSPDLYAYPQELLEVCHSIASSNIVEDILFTPALLQISDRSISGKVFVDIIFTEKNKPINIPDLLKIETQIEEFKKSCELKVHFTFTTFAVLKLKFRYALFAFPIEGLYRQDKCTSLLGRKYKFPFSNRETKQAIIHFSVKQRLRFRSPKLESGLMGSKFIKSLNLMNRYALIMEYVEGRRFLIPKNYSEMLEKITPQLHHMKARQPLSTKEWPYVVSQLRYLLAKIYQQL